MLELDVLASNADAQRLYDRWGFKPVELHARSAASTSSSSDSAGTDGPTFGVVHVQTDDVEKVKRDAQKFLPARAGRRDLTRAGSRVRSDATDADPERLKALAKELSYTTGGVVLSLGVERGAVVRYDLFDRGADIDEYLSVPGVLRAAAAGRRLRARREPDGRRRG